MRNLLKSSRNTILFLPFFIWGYVMKILSGTTSRATLKRQGANFNFIVAVLFASTVLAFASCFNFDGGDTSTVRIGSSGERTVLPTAGELLGMTYRASFTGPGGSVYNEFGSNGGTVQLQAGNWNYTVKACNSEPRLRGIAEGSLRVTSSGKHVVNMTSCIGIKNETDLSTIMSGSPVGSFNIGKDSSAKGNLLVLENDISVSGSIIVTSGNYTLISDPQTTLENTRHSPQNGNII
jgi:hypothetical protein